jgi:hypothetical protein
MEATRQQVTVPTRMHVLNGEVMQNLPKKSSFYNLGTNQQEIRFPTILLLLSWAVC